MPLKLALSSVSFNHSSGAFCHARETPISWAFGLDDEVQMDKAGLWHWILPSDSS